MLSQEVKEDNEIWEGLRLCVNNPCINFQLDRGLFSFLAMSSTRMYCKFKKGRLLAVLPYSLGQGRVPPLLSPL